MAPAQKGRSSWVDSQLVARLLVAASIVSSGIAYSQTAAGPSGHWEGAIQVPGQEIKIEIDLQGTGDKWEGTITIPAQGLKGLPLSGVAVTGESVRFAIGGIPGEPQFKGTLSKDAKAISGDFAQGGGTVPFSVARTGEAKIEPLPKSTPITKDFEGSWEGTLDIQGKTLRLVFKLSNQKDGIATGTIVSVDQGGVEIPIAAVVQRTRTCSWPSRRSSETTRGTSRTGSSRGCGRRGRTPGRWCSSGRSNRARVPARRPAPAPVSAQTW